MEEEEQKLRPILQAYEDGLLIITTSILKTKITRISKYLYIVSIYKDGVWLKYSEKGMCLADAKAAKKRIEKW